VACSACRRRRSRSSRKSVTGARLGQLVLTAPRLPAACLIIRPPRRRRSLLFLFNVRTRQLMGVLQPIGPPGMNLEPAAWGARFPVQVRFRPLQTRVWPGRVSWPAPVARTCSNASPSAARKASA
jgi:hypothetical protein